MLLSHYSDYLTVEAADFDRVDSSVALPFLFGGLSALGGLMASYCEVAVLEAELEEPKSVFFFGCIPDMEALGITSLSKVLKITRGILMVMSCGKQKILIKSIF